MFRKLFLALVSVFWLLESTESSILSQTQHPELGIVELQLKNGMRVCLKPTTFDEDEVLIRLTARGGYAALPAAQRAAGELSALVAWESGLEGISTDKLTAMIYQHSIELYAKVMPYHRIIEGTTDEEGVQFFFDLVKRYSTQKHFTKEGFDRIVALTRETICQDARSCPSHFKAWSHLSHTQNIAALAPLSIQDLHQAKFEQAKHFFETSFSNPADFVCVIVGHFKIEKALPLIDQYLGAIPGKEKGIARPPPQMPQFPEGITIRQIPVPDQKESIARLTYPFPPIRSPERLRFAKLLGQIVESRIRSYHEPFPSVSFELPIYPGLYLTWLAIQYRAPPTKVNAIKDQICEGIRQLLLHGASEAEIDACWKQLRQKEDLWQKDNQYWLTLLSDHFLRGWEWKEMQKTLDMQEPPTPKEFQEFLKAFLQPDQFSFIYTQLS